jgi:hypothetical protein
LPSKWEAVIKVDGDYAPEWSFKHVLSVFWCCSGK